MLKSWVWIIIAIVAGAAAAAIVTGLEGVVFLILPNLDPAGPSPGLGPVLVILLVVFSFPCWLAGLAVLGLPLGLALRRIGRDGYVSAILAGAIGGAIAVFVILAVMEGFQGFSLLVAYPLMAVLPGAAAGAVTRWLAYR
ncbi:hypothetical protein BH10PSE2_BH10PSE2_15590 [soil metagenome]